MTISVALCVIDENKSQDYRTFKKKLEESIIKVYETIKVHRCHGDQYKDKLNTVLKECTAIVILCTESIKGYLNGEAQSLSELLKENERQALEEGFATYQRKVILVNKQNNLQRNDVVPRCVSNPILYDTFYNIEQIDDVIDEILSCVAG